jgi:hypothetical protein
MHRQLRTANSPFPIPHSQFPIPNSLFPIPNSQTPKILYLIQMRTAITGLSVILIGLGGLLLFFIQQEPQDTPSTIVRALPEQSLQYESHVLESSVVHTVLIPSGSRFSVRTALSEQLTPLEPFAQQHGAVAAINGGFFDPNNQKTTSYVIREGQLVADPRLNEGLMDNPDNAPYLEQILTRSEWRRYQCGETIRYDIARRGEPVPDGCQLSDALGGGPRLLPEIASVAEGFVDIVEGEIIRDALGSRRPNARSAVGITREGDMLLVMVAQLPDAPTDSGMSLPALADFMKAQGIEEAMNLDGGSSASLYFRGEMVYGKVDGKGNRVERAIKSAILVLEADS